MKNAVRTFTLVSSLLIANAAFAGPSGCNPRPTRPPSDAASIITQAINVLQNVLGL